jgi:hypothetical protein
MKYFIGMLLIISCNHKEGITEKTVIRRWRVYDPSEGAKYCRLFFNNDKLQDCVDYNGEKTTDVYNPVNVTNIKERE